MKHNDLIKFTRLALLTALMFVMSFTPLGYLPINPALNVTFLTIPVIIGAVTDGKSAGAFLGGVFGLTSFIQAWLKPLSMTGVLFAMNPFLAACLCFLPRILTGFLCGLICELLQKTKCNRTVSVYLTALSCPLMNTLFFISTLLLLFGNTDYMIGKQNGQGILVFAAALVGINGVLEAVICPILGTAISRPLLKIFKKNQ